MSGPLEPGERVLLLDSRGRRYLVRLEAGSSFHFHAGIVPFDLLIGAPEGTIVHTNTGGRVSAFRPRLVDFILKMGRGAQVIYPKDIGPLLVYADVFPGASVLEAGTGSGALTLALCRAAGSEGRVVSYDLRPEFQEIARANVESFFGKAPPQLELRPGDVRQVAATTDRFDRVLLDMPEPEGVLEAVTAALDPGGIVACYLPTTGQVQGVVAALEHRGFDQVEVFEVLLRTWHVEARSVRPDHRMVGHTGFITVARAGPGP